MLNLTKFILSTVVMVFMPNANVFANEADNIYEIQMKSNMVLLYAPILIAYGDRCKYAVNLEGYRVITVATKLYGYETIFEKAESHLKTKEFTETTCNELAELMKPLKIIHDFE